MVSEFIEFLKENPEMAFLLGSAFITLGGFCYYMMNVGKKPEEAGKGLAITGSGIMLSGLALVIRGLTKKKI